MGDILETPTGKNTINKLCNSLTPFHLVLSHTVDSAEIVAKMLEMGASVHINKDGRTPLHWYCSMTCQMPKIVELLVEAGSNVNQQVFID